MPGNLKRNAVAVVLLSALLYWSFMLAKHAPSLRDIIPFGEDPYDAVGSFGTVIGVLLALISFVRAFRPYSDGASTMQIVYLIRSQMGVVLAVLITVVADAVAMARHPRMWTGAASRYELSALLIGLVLAALAVLWLLRSAQRKLLPPRSVSWVRASLVTLFGVLLLALYPEHLIDNISTHLLTIIAGAVLLFAPMRVLLMTLVPCEPDKSAVGALPRLGFTSSIWRRWSVVLLLGGLMGFCAFASEMLEHGGAPSIHRLLFVGSVFISVGLAGFAIAYAFLRNPLGLGPQS